MDWQCNLRIVLKHEWIAYVLDMSLPPLNPLPLDATTDEVELFNKHHTDNDTVVCIILTSMSSELQKQHEYMNAYDIMVHLQDLFGARSRSKKYEISKELFTCRMAKGTLVIALVLKMIGYIEKLNQLNCVMDH